MTPIAPPSVMASGLSRAAVLLILIALAGCGPKSFDDPVAEMLNTKRPVASRIAAARQAEAQRPNDIDRLANLRRLVMDRGHPAELRNEAIDQLIRYDEPAAKAFLRDAVMVVNNWETLHYLFATTVERDWRDFTPAIVRNYSRRAFAYTDANRPERAALEALNPGQTPEQVAFDVFQGGHGADVKERAAAWQLLVRLIDDNAELIAMLRRANDDGPMVMDLKAGATDLHVVATNVEEIAWLQTLRSKRYAPFYNVVTEVVSRLDDEQKRGLALRHLATLAALAEHDDPLLSQSRRWLDDALRQQLSGDRHYLKSATYDGQAADHPQLLAKWADELTWADLIVMHVARRAMADRRTAGQWFRQADADHRNETTEFGGLLLVAEEGYEARSYEPMIRRHDNKYIPPAELITDGYVGIAHYHFHAQSRNNAKYAGPGLGDLKGIGDRHRMTGLVLTFVDENTMNVDYYRAGRVVVDLGTIRR